MAESALNIGLEIIRDLLIEEARFLRGVRGELEDIEKGLMRMKAFLQYADGKEDEDMGIHNRVKETRKISEEVVGVLETFAFKVKRRQKKRFSFIFNEHITLRSQIVSIKTKITNLSISFEIYDIEQGQSSDSASNNQHYFRSYSHYEEDLIGVENDVRILVDQLVDEENNCDVVSICGMGGLGKTSLARKVFNCLDVRRCFDLFSWVYITEHWQTKDVLQQILIGLVPQERAEIMEMRDRELVEKLYEVQQKKKCLVVIDDIWLIDIWDSLRPAFPIGKTEKRSKVLFTTRIRQIAALADPIGFIHIPQLLTEEYSWDLLQKIAFGRRYSEADFTIDPKIEKSGRDMVRRCRGLPLAVKVLGGILMQKHIHSEWEMVLQNLRNIIGSSRSIFYVLDLSYNSLPNQLKQCFLFFGKFPYNFEMKATRIYHLWIAEGIVSVDRQEQEETMLDVAKRYLGELAQRYMVQVHVKEASITIRYKSCRLHDLMRELCLSKLEGINTTKIRHYYYNSDQHDNDDDGDLADQRYRHVQSLVILSGGEEFWVKTKPNLNNFQLLRVLDLEGVEINGGNLPESIENLVQLRYLSLRCTSSSWGFWELPSSISNLQYLQILDLRTAYPLLIPDVLFNLKRLTHLYLPTRIDFDREKVNKLRLGGLSKLETLVNFNLNNCHVEDLKSLRNLRKLKAEVWEGFECMCNLVNIITSAKTLLKESKLKIMGFSFLLEKELETLNKLLGCHHLCKLCLQGPIRTFPGHDHFSKSLTELNLWESRLEEDPMPTLEKLPSLFSLHIGRDVFMGNEMVCSPRGFPQLRTLVLVGLPNLVNWEVNKGAFPKLSLVKIHSCKKLKMIPDGLKFIATLDEVCIHHMPEEFEFRNKAKVAKEKQVEDIHKVRHNPTITYYNTVRPLDRTRMERTGPKKNGKQIEQASAKTNDRISEVPGSSQTVLLLREHGSTATIGPDGHGCMQTLWLGLPTDIFSKPSRQYDAIRRTNQEAANIEKMETEIKLWKEKIDLMEKEVQNLKNLMLSRDNMTDLPPEANTNSRQVPDASSAHQPRLAAEVEPRHQELSSSNATTSIS